MFAHVLTGALACRRYSPELLGKFALLPIYLYSDVGSFRAGLQTNLPVLVNAPITSLFYTNLLSTLPLTATSSINPTFYTDLTAVMPAVCYSHETYIEASGILSPMSAGLKSGLTHYYSLDDNLLDSVNAGTPGTLGGPIGFDFANGLNGMTGSGASLTLGASSLIVTSTSIDPMLITPVSSSLESGMSGTVCRYIRLQIKRNAGTGWDGTVYYATGGHTYSGTYNKTFTDPTAGTVGGYVDVTLDMWALSVGGTDWKDNAITSLRFDFGASTADVFEIRYIFFTVGATDPVTLPSYEVSPIAGKALRLNGGHVKLPDTINNSSTQTISLWATGTGTLYSKGSDRYDGWGLRLSDDLTSVYANVVTTSPSPTSYPITVAHQITAPEVARHYLLEFDNTNKFIRLTVNNGISSIVATGSTIRGTNGNFLGMERSDLVGTFGARRNGTIDEVGFWNRLLTAQEKADLYNKGVGLTYAAPTVALSATNALTGLASSAFSVVGPVFSFDATRVNDGTLLTKGSEASTFYSRTLGADSSSNNGHGVSITFATAKRLGRFKLSCYNTDYGGICDFQAQAYIAGVWTNAGTPTANTNSVPSAYPLRDIDFNLDGTMSSTQWRVVIANWSGTNTGNFYAGELQAFERL